jgi:AraC-like DNA-binding protein
MDQFSKALLGTRLIGSLMASLELKGAWNIDFESLQTGAPTHYVLETDELWLDHCDGSPLTRLVAGDLVMFPHWDRHLLMSNSDAGQPIKISELAIKNGSPGWQPGDWQDAPLNIKVHGMGKTTRIISFVFELDDVSPHPLFLALPRIIHHRNNETQMAAWFKLVLGFITDETQNRPMGYTAVSSRLLELLFIQILRMQLTRQPTEVAGWLRTLIDPHLGPLLADIQANPGHDWSIPNMARHSGLSRSIFCNKFKELMQETPANHVRKVRLEHAVKRLVEGASVKQVAQETGYATTFAFTKAFRQVYGMTPGRYRAFV